MPDLSVSVPVTLSDLERPDARNIFFRRILIMLVRSATSLHWHKCGARFLSATAEFLVHSPSGLHPATGRS